MDGYIQQRRNAVAAAWDLSDEIVLVGAGHEATMPGRGDQVHPFRGHPEYVWLTDREGPFRILAFDPGEGWTDFAPSPTPEEAVWSEPGEPGDAPLADLEAWLEVRQRRPLALLGDAPGLPGGDAGLALRLRSQMAELRLVKDDVELERMRAAALATAAGYEAARAVVRPGVTERRIQVELEAEFARAGGDRLAYDTIVASGPRAAVLHALPTDRVLGADELVLLDAGAEVRFYAADVTRTWPVSGELSGLQRDIYDLVLEGQVAAVEACRPRTAYGEVHRSASRTLTSGLVGLGILRGDVEELMADGVQTLFFPHGVGHPVGLGVRCAGPQIRPAGHGPPPPGALRVEFTLRPGCTVTIEPGLYFHPALLQDPDRRRRYGDRVDWDRALGLVPLGGVRIEDNVHVTGEGPEVLTSAIPKRI